MASLLIKSFRNFLSDSSLEAHVMVLFGKSSELQEIIWSLERYQGKAALGKVFILTSHWEFVVTTEEIDQQYLKVFHSALQFRVHSRDVPEFKHFLRTVNPLQPQGDIFLRDWWENAFQCTFGKSSQWRKCTQKEKLQDLPDSTFGMSMTSQSYSIYNAVYSMAHALHAAYVWKSKRGMMGEGQKRLNIQPWQVKSFYNLGILI